MMFEKIFIANRGEIALRIARTCHDLGIPCAVGYSSADRDVAIAGVAGQAVHLGPAPAARSYLSIPSVIEAARLAGADAIHPGYGFLSEDPDFSEVCAESGLAFIGPDPQVLALFGDKAAARALAVKAELPLLPGSDDVCRSERDGRRLAERIGYPVVVKAVAGGGGKGMAVVTDPDAFGDAFRETTAAALAVFGDGRVYVERYLRPTRHVEVQVLRDAHGAAVYLGDRDCSVQRRHQKLIEEAPAPALGTATRQAMGEAAVRCVALAGLVGVATVEFLVDRDERFYFMEVNARLQVEHPVTEMVTGLDLVEQQIRLAAGEHLGLAQDDVTLRGSAIECRMNAEDPEHGFLPTPGLLTGFRMPGGPFVRVDTHLAAGLRVPAEYDSLLAKIVAWGPDRATAVARTRRALREVTIEGAGIRSTKDLLQRVLGMEVFTSARHGTDVLEQPRSGRS
jgi:acetyl-CoA carboxylase biotin carboxylase subunit